MSPNVQVQSAATARAFHMFSLIVVPPKGIIRRMKCSFPLLNPDRCFRQEGCEKEVCNQWRAWCCATWPRLQINASAVIADNQ